MTREHEQRRVMVLGAGTMQLPVYQAIKQLGWYSIAVDGNPAAPAASMADEFHAIDLKNKEAIAERAAALHAQQKLHGIFTAGTDFSASVAWVAEKLGLPGIPWEVALNATDKTRMRTCFEKAGIGGPCFVRVEKAVKPEEIQAVLEKVPLPWVVKPVDNMGARGVSLVSGQEQAIPAIELALGLSRTHAAIVEEFIAGQEYSIDSLVFDGKLHECGIGVRHIFFAPHFVELGHTIPARLPADQKQSLVEGFTRAVQSLGISFGAAKGDVFLQNGRPVIGEIAARLSGGYMSGWTFPYASGVELTREALLLYTGGRPANLEPVRGWTSAERAFISIPGIVQEIRGLEAARGIKHVRELFVRIQTGDQVRFPTNNVEKCGNIISTAPTHEEAVSSAQDAVASILVRLKPANPETAAFLYGSRPPAWPFYPNLTLSDDMPWISESALRDGSQTIKVASFSIIKPDTFDGTQKDWNHRSLDSALGVLAAFATDINPRGQMLLGRVFWQALKRGGVQGALWCLETLAAAGDPHHRAEAWKSGELQ